MLKLLGIIFSQKTIFQGLSQEALHACVQSLKNASNLIISSGKTDPNKESVKVSYFLATLLLPLSINFSNKMYFF